MRDQNIHKIYIARVDGIVQSDEWVCEKKLFCKSFKEGIWDIWEGTDTQPSEVGHEANADQPEQKISEAKAIDYPNTLKNNKKAKSDKSTKANRFKKEEVKTAKTIFRKIWADEKTNTSLVECQPVTGRTHQIRLHLKASGFIIINDIVYGGRCVGNLYRGILEAKLGTAKRDGGETLLGKRENMGEGGEGNSDVDMYRDLQDDGSFTKGRDDKILEIWLHAKRYS
jgi:23S rRNA-/tRNA-specific pseudouridylate synthase